MSDPIRRLSIGVNARLERVFAERRVTIRTETGASYWRLSPLSQLFGCLFLMAALGWLGFASFTTVANTANLAVVEERLAHATQAYESRLRRETDARIALSDTLSQARQEMGGALDALSSQTGALAQSVSAKAQLSNTLSQLRGQTARLEDAYASAVESCAATVAHAQDLETALATEQGETASLTVELTAMATALEKSAGDRDETLTALTDEQKKTADLTNQLAKLEDQQARAFARIGDAAKLGLSSLETLFSKSGANLDAILKTLKREKVSADSPFRPLDKDLAKDETIRTLFADLRQVNQMRIATERMPYARPVKGSRLSSGFGSRRDPKTGRRRAHNGIDYANRRGTPIYSTGDGVVLYSGRERGYGNIVKIRHAFGYESVYAHLHRRRVKVGDRVARGDRIGDMGNTGRSTGTHLHYEIRVNGRPINPAKYIEAARDVL